MELTPKNIIYEKKEEIATITINRPQVLNALNRETLHEMKKALEDAQKDNNIKVVIITGSGSRAFCAGADVSELKRMGPAEVSDLVKLGQETFTLIEDLDKPVIAAVNGVAFGGGFELSMACDLIITAGNARFGQPEVNLGIMPGWGGTQKLTRLIGIKKAKEIMMLGNMISADEALNMLIVNKVVPAEKLMDEAVALAKEIAGKSPIALKFAKKAINAAMETALSQGINYERTLYMWLFSTEDAQEGISAFLEKRKPIWKGK